MGIEKVRDEVLAKAKSQAAAIIFAAKKDEDLELKKAEEKAEERKKQTISSIELEATTRKNREVASAELEVSKMILEAKKKLIYEVFSEAKQLILKTPASDRREHVRNLLQKGSKNLEVSKVYINEKDLKYVEGIKALTLNITGGIILENKDGTIRLDLSYDTILEESREALMKDVARILFKE